jgi:LuxR family maltose regulon positive regulatory protein
MGDLTGAIRWAQESGLSFDDESCRPVARYITYACILIACALSGVGADLRRPDTVSVGSRAVEEKPTSRQMLAEALALLTRLLSMAEGAGAKGHAVELLALQSIVLQAQGKPDCALTALERALSLAEPEGYVRTFVDQGEPMGVLLRQAAARGIAVDYVRTLLDALERETVTSETPPAVHPALIEPLTERELEVLRLLVVGLSNKAIAGALVIAEGTVKQHLKHIYGKLEVHNRTEAARRAGELDLV